MTAPLADLSPAEAARVAAFDAAPTPSEIAAVQYIVSGDWLVLDTGRHNCGVGLDGHYGAHEPGCGLEPVERVSVLLEVLAPVIAALPPSPSPAEGALRDALRAHHPIMRSETGPFSGCRCGEVKLGQDVIAHVVGHLRAALPPSPAYPRASGDVTVIGPECFASADGSVICWRGVNFYTDEGKYAADCAALASPAPAPQGGGQR